MYLSIDFLISTLFLRFPAFDPPCFVEASIPWYIQVYFVFHPSDSSQRAFS